MELSYDNVDAAFTGLVTGIHSGTFRQVACDGSHYSIEAGPSTFTKKMSRNGGVTKFSEPVTIKYRNPRHRVLFNTARDCNHFFHLFESLWMLAGCNDIEPLLWYNSKYKNYSDDGKTANGAYGYRWRNAYGGDGPSVHQSINGEWWEQNQRTPVDQLNELIEHLKEHPDTRRAVLQMWNVKDDLLKVDDRHGQYSKDVCCNTGVYFSMREVTQSEIEDHAHNGYVLDMTVTNRSNDAIWGMLGANIVHFSFLQEYMANCIGVGIGRYCQFTNDLHVYDWNWKPEEWLKGKTPAVYPTLGPFLVQDKQIFDTEVSLFVGSYHNRSAHLMLDPGVWKESFLREVAAPLMLAFAYHKERNYTKSYEWLAYCVADDWRTACHKWLNKREDLYLKKTEPNDEGVAS